MTAIQRFFAFFRKKAKAKAAEGDFAGQQLSSPISAEGRRKRPRESTDETRNGNKDDCRAELNGELPTKEVT